MAKLYILILLFLFWVGKANSQVIAVDSMNVNHLESDYWGFTNWLPANASELKTGNVRVRPSNDRHFLFAMGILILFASFKLFFPKYINDIFQMLTRSAIRTKHIKDQLESNIAASLLLNLFFCITTGTFIYLIIIYQHPQLSYSKTLLVVFCILSVMVVYFIKYVGLVSLGWIFQVKNKVSDYIFTVFYFNKIMGVLLMPIVVFLLINRLWTLPLMSVTLVILCLLMIYRYFLAYISIAKTLQMSSFHFFLYFCTVELAPILVLCKMVINNYGKIL